MAWTQPKTWTNEPLVAGDLNTHLRDNMEALKDPPSDHYEPDEVLDYSTTSNTFVGVDNTNLAFTLETNGGDVMVGFHGTVHLTGIASTVAYFDVTLDGVLVGGDDGIIAVERSSGSGSTPQRLAVSFVRLIPNLEAGNHVFRLRWKVSAGTLSMFAGAGTAGFDLHPQFWAREVS